MCILGISVSTFTIVSSWESLNTITAVVFVNGLIASIVGAFLCFYFATKLFMESKDFVKTQGCISSNGGYVTLGYECLKRQHLLKKYWRSFPVLKIFFFETNFFERSTPLVILNLSLNVEVSMILI